MKITNFVSCKFVILNVKSLMNLWYFLAFYNVFFLRAASPKYRLNQEIAIKWNFFKLAQNEVFRALVTKIIV